MFFFCSSLRERRKRGESTTTEKTMQLAHDAALRATARAIYETCYPSDEWTDVDFDEAERVGTLHYRQAVDAAHQARVTLVQGRDRQLALL